MGELNVEELSNSSADAASSGLFMLLQQIVDYAGLFPPAKLPMDATVRNYAESVRGPHAWMLGRLVLPVARFDEFERDAAGVLPTEVDDEPWMISALTAPASDADALQRDLAAIARFNDRHSSPTNGLAVIDVIELAAETTDAIDRALDLVSDEIFPFFELALNGDPRGLIAALSGADAGAKARTGGSSAELVPTPDELARFILACAAVEVPFKATAGLHHPLRHRAEAISADEFGFLNVFAAAALAFQHNVDARVIRDLLIEPDRSAFTFNDDGLTWREHQLSIDDLDDTRLVFAISFGSCSFVEPIADLQAMGLL